MSSPMKISVCIATYRRPERLAAVLEDLARQQFPPTEVVVVDNDSDASATATVEHCAQAGTSFRVRYAVQPRKNIALTRNMTVELACEDWLAFIDDDERAPAFWLTRLTEAVEKFRADVVLGPVEPVVPDEAPDWIRRGRFYDFPRVQTGSVVPPNRLRFGNVLIRGELLRTLGVPPFDPAYGLTGGEDGDLLSRLTLRGARIIWCNEAFVEEPIEKARLSLKWLLRRNMRGGQDFARHLLSGRYGVQTASRSRLFTRALLQMILAGVLTVVALPFGRHHAAHWLTKASANLGKLSIFLGWHYHEYA
jgi:succinoglycan biosynthesis protein ExoM